MDLPLMRDAIDAATAGIGARLMAIRQRKALRVSELARGAGVSSSLISQIERGSSKPSVGTLFALAQVLEVPVDDFFTGALDDPVAAPPPAPLTDEGGEEPTGATVRDQLMTAAEAGPVISWRSRSSPHPVVRREERASLDIRGGVRWERLTPTALDGVEFLELVYSPGAESDRQAYRHPGVELVLALEGTMTVCLGFDDHELAPGDSMAFPSSTPHRYVNRTDAEARAVTVILRDDLSRLRFRDTRQDDEATGPDGPPEPA